MEENQNNRQAVVCHVKDCAHHAKQADTCALKTIVIGSQEKHPASPEGTACVSFTAEEERNGREH